ncbi:tRNA uridine-5-carboxymethylaminomethyl(34) synthesis GTPase MnmE [Thermodesulforhabdus norvegica]|uniref:tRNA modification GTPase MnmE n=1 Tax=Thermodesulforhabdus norvegica TaxID=39841 RepID=A0A1I4TDI9_9BACT|nr:tRNA uridine-5-carboxymethylaminomethyl(34) synthesis GTPase MnmE [Thermodesulforhabdus norvegica]SFM74746.1 tRNA modification GTPase trmE [Thermodesulforhabdus norvegica]
MIRDLTAKDTICAIATPLGLGGIGIVRISGKASREILSKIFRPSRAKFPLKSHRLYHGWVYDPGTGERLDEVLVSYMKAPHTYTREDVVEINCHSGYVILEEILRLVLKCGARLADPGEFTYRAFLHGRIDLAQAEAVADIVESKSRRALDIARRQLEGALSSLVSSWLDLLTDIMAHLEAAIDFEEDTEGEIEETLQLAERLKKELIDPIEKTERESRELSILREGVRLALVGKPNVGKSSIMNALLKRERALVTHFPGTTRDIIEDTFVLEGIPITIMDTAGIRRDADYIERLGIERAISRIGEANIILWILDLSVPLSKEDDEIFELLKKSSQSLAVVLNKADLAHAFGPEDVKKRYGIDSALVTISAIRPGDVDMLKGFIKNRFLKEAVEAVSESFVVSKHHREYLNTAVEALLRVYGLMLEGASPEIVLVELYDAKKALETILGKGDVGEGILDRIFSRFCIGK